MTQGFIGITLVKGKFVVGMESTNEFSVDLFTLLFTFEYKRVIHVHLRTLLREHKSITK